MNARIRNERSVVQPTLVYRRRKDKRMKEGRQDKDSRSSFSY